MTMKHLLVHLDGGERASERLALAIRMAGRLGARLTGLFAEGGDARVGAGGSRGSWREAQRRAAADFEARTREARLQREWWEIPDGELEVGGVAARYCRYADLAIVGQHDPEDPRVASDFAAQVMLESGRPVLVVPWIGRYADVGRRVVVAWDGSREAARALNDAVPLMVGAERVSVCLLLGPRERVVAEDPSRPSVARHLAAHGITAEYEPVRVDGKGRDRGVAQLDAVLNVGSDLGADLVVMGARGRYGVPFPRARRGTRASLASMTAPVLFSV